MKKWNLTLKSIAVVLMAASVWSCGKDDNPPIEDEDTGDTVGTVYFEENFEKMVWGGDYIKQEEGIRGGFLTDGDNNYIINPDEDTRVVTMHTDGAPDFFQRVALAYQILRGIDGGWGGHLVYERPGYIKIGTASSRDAFIRTPPMAEINESSVKLKVTADLAIWEDASENIKVFIINGGVPSVNEVQVSTHDSFTEVEFEVANATSNTQIEFKSDPTTHGRFFVSSIKVTKAE